MHQTPLKAVGLASPELAYPAGLAFPAETTRRLLPTSPPLLPDQLPHVAPCGAPGSSSRELGRQSFFPPGGGSTGASRTYLMKTTPRCTEPGWWNAGTMLHRDWVSSLDLS